MHSDLHTHRRRSMQIQCTHHCWFPLSHSNLVLFKSSPHEIHFMQNVLWSFSYIFLLFVRSLAASRTTTSRNIMTNHRLNIIHFDSHTVREYLNIWNANVKTVACSMSYNNSTTFSILSHVCAEICVFICVQFSFVFYHRFTIIFVSKLHDCMLCKCMQYLRETTFYAILCWSCCFWVG